MEPCAAVSVNGVVRVKAPTVTFTPDGLDVTDTFAVRKSTRRVTDDASPVESVAVSVTSIHEGYSWSGMTNDPDATPLVVPMACWWQSTPPSPQCWTTRDQLSPVAGTAPSWGSVAEPAKLTTAPAAKVDETAGDEMTGVGALLPTRIWRVAVADTP